MALDPNVSSVIFGLWNSTCKLLIIGEWDYVLQFKNLIAWWHQHHKIIKQIFSCHTISHLESARLGINLWYLNKNELHKFYSDKSGDALKKLQLAAVHNENMFGQLMEATKYCSLGQITQSLFDVGGQYRRNM